MKITILADNTATPPYRSEHGFSALVETRDSSCDSSRALLFDVGMGVLFDNASVSGVDLSLVSDIVLSHGHYDHTDALASVLERYPSARVHASGEAFADHYSLRTGACRNISLSDKNRGILSALPQGQFVMFGDTDVIECTRINLAGRIPREYSLESPSPLLFADASCTVPDEVTDEIVLWVDTPAGLVILTGCCHAGFVNTCEYVCSVSGIDAIHAVIGGFHLANVGEGRLRATADYIQSRKISRVVPCHCTGDPEIEWLRSRLGSGVVTKGECGTVLVF